MMDLLIRMTKVELREAIIVDTLCYIEIWPGDTDTDYDGFLSRGVPRRSRRCFEGTLTPPCQRASSRVLQDLVADGLIATEAWGIGDAATHLKPTAELIRQTPKLTNGQADLDKIARSLALTDWGKDLADVARKAGASDE